MVSPDHDNPNGPPIARGPVATATEIPQECGNNLGACVDYVRRLNWRTALRLRLYESTGNKFQDFFADVMEMAFGDGYVRVRPYGKLGDKGCDGYRVDTGAVHQCYAPMQQSITSVATLQKKMSEDFELALKELPKILKSWVFTHNFMDGLPVGAIETREALLTAHPGKAITFFGAQEFYNTVLALDEQRIEDLLGPVPSGVDYTSPDIAKVASLLAGISQSAHRAPAAQIKPVPIEKISFNELSEDTSSLINHGMLNEPAVEEYLNASEPTFGDQIASALKAEYLRLRDQAYEPDVIFAYLLDFILGPTRVTVPSVSEHVAAQAIAAYFFHACDIFEDVPIGANDTPH
jgi:hypothetical protein